MQILTVDPGMDTGIVVADYNEAEGLLTILGRWEVSGGLEGLLEWDMGKDVGERMSPVHDHIVCEKFRVGPRAYRQIELEPLRIEGAIASVYGVKRVAWQYNDAMGLAGNLHDRARTKRAADDVLRTLGLWSTGSQVGHKDANDVNSAMKHLVAWLRSKECEIKTVEYDEGREA